MKPGSVRKSAQVALVAAIALILTGCHGLPRHPCASAMVLADIAAREKPSRLKKTTVEPSRATVSFQIEGRAYKADLYRPDNEIKAGIILVPGAAETGKDDPRLIAFGITLARAQFAVLVPDLVALRKLDLGHTNVQGLLDAVAYLSSKPELAPENRLGIAAMSFAVGLAVLAAMEPQAQHNVRFILGVGAYYDLEQVLTYFTTGYFRDTIKKDRPWQYMKPDPYGKWVFVLSHADRISNSSDARILRQMARLKLKDPAAPVESLANQLGDEGRAYYALLANKDPERVPGLLRQVPAGIKTEFDSLNLARHDLSKLNARLLLFHGRDDDIIPYTESVALTKAAGQDTRLYLVNALAHVNVRGIGLRDRINLWHGIGQLLRERR
jgi:pimeloyl-ACP methyl ester carboxylesterase